jgi:ribosomal protein S18 acetylase RimI-like enzyme
MTQTSFQFQTFNGEVPREVMRVFAATLTLAEAAILANQWEASQTAKDWQDWRSITASDATGTVVAAIIARCYPGNMAAVWPPQVCRSGNSTNAPQAEALCDDLLQRLIKILARDSLTLLQVTLPSDDPSGERLLRNQFRFAAELLYLSCAAECFPAEPPRGELCFEPYTTVDLRALTAIVEETYRQTLDCPALNGLRTTAEVIAGYQASGTSGTEHWRLIRHRDQLVGCLILAEHAPHAVLELIYMGIAPQGRGRGWGAEVVEYAKWLSGTIKMSQLVLTVDEANHPARRIYDSAGFSSWDRRRVFLRPLEIISDDKSQPQ